MRQIASSLAKPITNWASSLSFSIAISARMDFTCVHDGVRIRTIANRLYEAWRHADFYLPPVAGSVHTDTSSLAVCRSSPKKVYNDLETSDTVKS